MDLDNVYEFFNALQNGKKLTADGWRPERYIYLNNGVIYNYGDNKFTPYRLAWIKDKNWKIWEEPTEKVKYYPVLIEIKEINIPTSECTTTYKIHPDTKFKTLIDAKLCLHKCTINPSQHTLTQVVRLVTEIPELITEHDE